jgi:hypothetical protein
MSTHDATTEWHGFRRACDREALFIGPIPERKRIAIYLDRGNVIEAVGYFTSEDGARRVLELLDTITEPLTKAVES